MWYHCNPVYSVYLRSLRLKDLNTTPLGINLLGGNILNVCGVSNLLSRDEARLLMELSSLPEYKATKENDAKA